MPAAYAELVRIYEKLEKHFRDMQDIEFTIQKGKLCMLQTRNGKRTGQAMVRIAVEMVEERHDHRRRGGAARRPRQARPAAAPDARSQGATRASSRAACRRRPAPPSARSSSTPTTPCAEAQKGER